MSAIFTHDETQRRLALESKAREEARRGSEIHTEIAPCAGFTRAEDYHQKYYLQAHDSLERELRAFYPDFREFVDSTAVARVNGYLDGGPAERLMAELESLGLSPEASRELLTQTR